MSTNNMYLLDSQILLWYLESDKRLSTKYSSLIKYSQDHSLSDCFVSVVSLWEITIKLKLGNLEISQDLSSFFQLIENNFQILNIEKKHLIKMSSLNYIHKDPFDRMLMAQAVSENYLLLTVDSNILAHKFIQTTS